MKLVIVESPKKCDTIGRYLGTDYHVMASQGHVRDLATKGPGGLGVDVTNDFSPTYSIDKKKIPIVNELRKEAKKASEVIIATDPDREGEAIGWHLTQVLGLDVPSTKRLEFHEITRDSIEEAIKNPRHLDMNLVASQETRRILDRIIGFKLSKLLQGKIKSKSAGRVQSATLKLICDHQKEIDAFVPEEYWTLSLDIKNDSDNLTVVLDKIDGKPAKIPNEIVNKEILNRLSGDVVVSELSSRTRKIESKPPFTTSTMEQEAFNAFGFTTKKTASIAQSLYEGLQIGNEHVGLITYMRVDSTRLSNTYINKALSYIDETFGKEYIGHAKQVKAAALSQDAHEAIRPTSNHRSPQSIRQYLQPDQYKLYMLIYNRALGSLMPAKVEEVTTIHFDVNGLSFKLEGVKTLFDGYEKLYSKENKTASLPHLEKGEKFSIVKINNKQEFTKAPAQYSEAKIVHLMEEKGIGRPSTYSSTIGTLVNHQYITDKGGIVIPTEQGILTSHVLEKYFAEFVDTKYTAKMEDNLDTIQDGSASRSKMLNDFYYPFIKQVEEGQKNIYIQPQKQVGICPKCGSPLVEKKSKYGTFVACSAYPKCDYVKKEEKKAPVFVGRNCPQCGKPLVERKDKKGKTFVACSGFPKCKYIEGQEKKIQEKPVEVKKCPKCNGSLILKKGKYGDFLGCSNFPKCRYQEKLPKKESE